MPIEIDELETARFGIVAARVTDSSADPDVIDAAAAAQGVQLLSCRLDVGNLPRVHALEAAGYRLMDTLVYYGRSLADTLPLWSVPSRVTCYTAKRVDSVAIGELARSAFSDYIGHYHSDPRLDNAAADAAYVEWAETIAANVSADAPVFLAKYDGHLAGFITLRRNNKEEAEIVLGGVYPEFKGHGIYAVMFATALEEAQASGAARVLLSTQINNYAVQRVYVRFGFTHERSVYTFHKWF